MTETVEVAVRIRPLVSSEINLGSRNILEVYEDIKQIRVTNSERAFTFNYVYNCNSTQVAVYETCVKNKVPDLFKGYNVTVLAYGQTGSGKTHTMGTMHSEESGEEPGIIPRVLKQIFELSRDNFTYNTTVSVSFLELYQETAYDLLSEKPRDQSTVDIREDSKGIIIQRLTEVPISNVTDGLNLLVKGSAGRATGSTNMNSQSSRSHAIFTVNVFLEHKQESCSNKTAKFHLVDLAGSERSKKTGATGQTFKEGININKGLLVLGNVIAALSDGTSSHIPYRDSNLTRLLKDSLGGNSITLMIACVSPADYNLDETLSTLRYADRAKRIKNKPIVNEDPRTAEIKNLHKTIKELKLQLLTNGGGCSSSAPDLQPELDAVKQQLDIYKKKSKDMMAQLSALLHEKAFLLEKQMNTQRVNEKFRDLKDLLLETLKEINSDLEQNPNNFVKEHLVKLESIKEKFIEVDMNIRDNENEFQECSLSRSNISIDGETEKEISERQEFHTEQQVALNCELQQITEELGMKERLAKEIARNNNIIIDYAALAEYDSKIAQLEKEKEELLQQLRLNPQEKDTKVSEFRTRKVKELEEKIGELKKKVQTQEKLIKLKEKDEEKIRKLNSEIVSLKQVKVKLLKNMKQEAERFRTWKNQREKEVIRLKEQNRKKEHQIVKMETVYSRQQNVLKRKMEEVNAANKRLKDALAVRKSVQENRNSGKSIKMEQWLKNEIEVYITVMQAQASLPILCEYRQNLQEQLDLTKQQQADCPMLQQLEEEIELRSLQIADMKQVIFDSNEEHKDKVRWDRIQSVSEAKSALKIMMETIGETAKKESAARLQVVTLQSRVAELEVSALENQNLKTELDKLRSKLAAITHHLKKSDSTEIKTEYETTTDDDEPLQPRKKESTEDLKLRKPLKARAMQTPVKCKANVSTDEEMDLDDLQKDPDWRKTPLGRKILRIRPSDDAFKMPIKRSLNGGCTCKGDCRRKICGCKKLGRDCTHNCKCISEVCKNRSNSENEPQECTSTTIDAENETKDDSANSKRQKGF